MAQWRWSAPLGSPFSRTSRECRWCIMGALAAGAVPRASCPKIMGKTRKKHGKKTTTYHPLADHRQNCWKLTRLFDWKPSFIIIWSHQNSHQLVLFQTCADMGSRHQLVCLLSKVYIAQVQLLNWTVFRSIGDLGTKPTTLDPKNSQKFPNLAGKWISIPANGKL